MLFGITSTGLSSPINFSVSMPPKRMVPDWAEASFCEVLAAGNCLTGNSDSGAHQVQAICLDGNMALL